MVYGRVPKGLEFDFLSFVLCSQVYHCTPKQLEDVDMQIALRHMVLFDECKKEEEREMREMRIKGRR